MRERKGIIDEVIMYKYSNNTKKLESRFLETHPLT